MTLSTQELSLLNNFRNLLPSTADFILHYVEHAAKAKLDYADHWTDEDMRDMTIASLERLDREES